jgi:hypothetical protein
MISDADLTYFKASCAEGERLATDTTMELIDEVRRLRSKLATLRENIPSEYCLNVLVAECCCNKSSKYKNGRDDEWEKAAAWLVMVMEVKNADR